MVKIKWGLMSGAVAFALAFLTSLLLGHTSFAVALLRAAVFAAVFFGLAIAIRALIANFIPDLLYSAGNDDNASDNIFSAGMAGSQVDITVEDAPDPALPEEDENRTTPIEVGSFNDLVVGSINTGAQSAALDIDQTSETSYTEEKEEITPVFGKVKLDDIGDFSMDFGAFVADDAGGDGTGDMDTFSFNPGGNSDSAHDTPEPSHTPSGNKPMKLEGDFDPKEIAAGIRTVLKKEKG
jgi:uncharacterized membrane protein (DUF485 family)